MVPTRLPNIMIILTEQFIIFHLVFYWAMFILYKNGLSRRIEEVGNKRIEKKKFLGWFLVEMSECSFCMNNWFSLIAVIPLAIYCNDYKILIWGILSASISAQLNR